MSSRNIDKELVTKGFLKAEFVRFEKRFEKKLDKKLAVRFGRLENKVDSNTKEIGNIKGGLGRLEKGQDLLMKKVFEHGRRFDLPEERTAYLPKLYDNVDKLLKEIRDGREDRIIMLNRLTNHETRITRLEGAAICS